MTITCVKWKTSLALPFQWMFLMYQMAGSLETAMLLFPAINNSNSDLWMCTKYSSILDSNSNN